MSTELEPALGAAFGELDGHIDLNDIMLQT